MESMLVGLATALAATAFGADVETWRALKRGHHLPR